MSIFSAMAGWFKGDPYSVPDEEAICACGGKCACEDSLQQESIVTTSVTEDNIRVYTQEEISSVVDTVVEEAEKIAEAAIEETKDVSGLTEEVIAAADKAAFDMLQEVRKGKEVQLPLPLEHEQPEVPTTVSPPKAKRVQKAKNPKAKRKK
jgi:hypothetical protein